MRPRPWMGGYDMEVRFKSARDAYGSPIMKPLAEKIKSDGGALTAEKPQQRDSITLGYGDVLSAEQAGVISRDGERYAVSPELAAVIRKTYDEAAVKNQIIQMRNTIAQYAENSKKQSEAMKKHSDDMLKAIEIAKRIAKGGRVPPEDEQFLLEYSQTMFMTAKMQAMMAKEHKEYDSLLEDEEETESGEVELDGTVHSARATVSGGEVVAVSEAVEVSG